MTPAALARALAEPSGLAVAPRELLRDRRAPSSRHSMVRRPAPLRRARSSARPKGVGAVTAREQRVGTELDARWGAWPSQIAPCLRTIHSSDGLSARAWNQTQRTPLRAPAPGLEAVGRVPNADP